VWAGYSFFMAMKRLKNFSKTDKSHLRRIYLASMLLYAKREGALNANDERANQ